MAKTGHTYDNSWIDSRSEAFKDMTDISREVIEKSVEKYNKINRNNPTPADRMSASEILTEIAGIYMSESNTSTTNEIAEQSVKIAGYLLEQSFALRVDNGNNKHPIISGDTVKNIALSNDSTTVVAIAGNNVIDAANKVVVSGASDSSVQDVADNLIAAALGNALSNSPTQNWEKFVKLQSGKIDDTTLDEIGKSYLADKVDDPEKMTSKAIANNGKEVSLTP